MQRAWLVLFYGLTKVSSPCSFHYRRELIFPIHAFEQVSHWLRLNPYLTVLMFTATYNHMVGGLSWCYPQMNMRGE